LKAGRFRWKAAGWLGARLPDIRGRDRIVGMVRGARRSCKPTQLRLVNGLVFNIGEASDGSVHSLFYLQYAKPALAPVFDHFADPGAVIYDVGANIGIYALWAAAGVGPAGQVHAFEPIPATAALLRQFIDANAASQVLVSEVAVGATSGVTPMFCMPHASGLASMTWRPGAVTINVDRTTLDEYLVEHDAPSLVKVDVEGHEPDVLAGGASLVLEHKPALLLEVTLPPDGDGLVRAMFASLRGVGYEVFDLTRRGLRVSEWPPSHNVLALDLSLARHRHALDELRSVRFPRNQTT